jgi:hypothetical protein
LSGQGGSGQSAFAALGQALQSGNLSAAQSAFSLIQSAAKGHHHHHSHGSTAAASIATATTATTALAPVSATTGTTLNATA